MATESTPVETPATDAPAGDTPATEDVTPVTETPVDGAPPAEGDPKPEGGEPVAAKADLHELLAKVPEDDLRKLGEKYANRTMAAARRSEKQVADLREKSTRLEGENKTFREFVQQLRDGDPVALRRVGFASTKEFLDKVVAHGGEPAAPTADERVAALERERDEARAKAQQAEVTAAIDASKKAVFTALDKDDRFDLVRSDLGHDLLWKEIEGYFAQYGECPDEAVIEIAVAVESHLEAQVAKSKRFNNGQRQPGNKGAANGNAEPGTLNPGKSVTAKGASGAPVVVELSNDPDERRRQVMEQMRAAGEI